MQLSNNTLRFIASKHKETKLFFILFYAVGIAGLLFPFSFQLFVNLIPFALVLSFLALVLMHSGTFDKKSILVFISIYFLGFSIEAIGVYTKFIFGAYWYGGGLGFKLFDTPLIIGLNWLFLVYTSSSVLEKLKIHTVFKVLLASLIMLAYDIILEQVAAKIDMWYWNENTIPIQNYVAWFVIALLFNSLLKWLKIKTYNKLALLILLCQTMFFLILFFYMR